MIVNTNINAEQLSTYLKSFNISTYLDVINYKTSFSLSNYVSGVNTNIFYKDVDIVPTDVNWQNNVTDQEKDLILTALNKLRLRVNC